MPSRVTFPLLASLSFLCSHVSLSSGWMDPSAHSLPKHRAETTRLHVSHQGSKQPFSVGFLFSLCRQEITLPYKGRCQGLNFLPTQLTSTYWPHTKHKNAKRMVLENIQKIFKKYATWRTIDITRGGSYTWTRKRKLIIQQDTSKNHYLCFTIILHHFQC